MIIKKLEEFHDKLIEFREEANQELDGKDVGIFHYSGDILTGNIENIDTLFIGINPGGGIDKKGKYTKGIEIGSKYKLNNICKYVGGYEDNWVISKNLIDGVLSENKDNIEKSKNYLIENCAETSFRSFFATRTVDDLNNKLNNLSDNLRLKHDSLTNEIFNFLVKELKPNKIVCIGVTLFDSIKDEYVDKNSSFETIKILSDNGSMNRRCFIESRGNEEINNIPIYGTVHLSFNHIPPVDQEKMLECLREEFNEIIKF